MKTPKTEKINVKDIFLNDKNPRFIKDENFKKLIKSINDFPEMLQLRPIVVDENNVILGGNMRYRACIEIGIKEVYILRAENLTEEQKTEFIFKDNIGYGNWDFDIIANEFDNLPLEDWGLIIPNLNNTDLDKFFEETDESGNNNFKITLEYTETEFALVTEAFAKRSGSKEQIVYQLLGL